MAASQASTSGEFDVIIVGAGAAGIAAAHALTAAGRKTIILEARTRMGGRAFTDTTLGPPFEAGASYIHWAERNPWVKIASDLGFATRSEAIGAGFQVFADGLPMPEAERSKRRSTFGQIDRRLEMIDLSKRDLSVSELLGDLGPELAPIAGSGLLLSIGEEADRISARDYQRLWAGNDLVVPSGYGNLVQRHGRGLDVRLGEPVYAVRWNGPGVEVTAKSGTLKARACIVTVPVGVLKAGTIRFTPELPGRTRDALNGIGMGALTKIAVRIEGERFGIRPGTSFLEVGSSHELMSFDLFPEGRDIVIAHCGGDHARDLARGGPQAARAHVTDVLAKIIGGGLRKAVSGVSFPCWWTDPFSRGSYSVCLPGSAGARDALSEPVGGHLWFAGEATAGGGAMTVGGATFAGRAAAAAIARHKV